MATLIEVYTNNDYDTLVKFLSENSVPIISNDMVKMAIVAELSEELEDKLDNDKTIFEGHVAISYR